MPVSIPPEFEEFRDERWHREATRQVESALDAERFIERVGFAACLTDSRRPGPSLYVAVCGRRDAVMPRNVQKDPEASAAWVLKDELVRRGKVYYGKLVGARTLFIAPRMVPFFHAIWGDATGRGSAAVKQTGAGTAARPSPRVGDRDIRLRSRLRREGPQASLRVRSTNCRRR